jgi:hypothetical protein
MGVSPLSPPSANDIRLRFHFGISPTEFFPSASVLFPEAWEYASRLIQALFFFLSFFLSFSCWWRRQEVGV